MSLAIIYPPNVAVHCATITKENPSAKLGINLKKSERTDNIIISSVSASSPLQTTSVKRGQFLLAVNGNTHLPSGTAAANLMASSITTSLLVCNPPSDSCMRVVAAPFWKHNPSILFSSTRGRALVCVSKIFPKGAFAGNQNINRGDIVVAVNGIPVSKPEDADSALKMPVANGSVTVLHVLNLDRLRARVIRSVIQTFSSPIKITLKKDSKSQQIFMLVAKPLSPVRRVEISYDNDTLHMADPKAYLGLTTKVIDYKDRVVFCKWYQDGALKFMTAFNNNLDNVMSQLEDDACEAAWKIQQGVASSTGDDTPIIAMASLTPVSSFENLAGLPVATSTETSSA